MHCRISVQATGVPISVCSLKTPACHRGRAWRRSLREARRRREELRHWASSPQQRWETSTPRGKHKHNNLGDVGVQTYCLRAVSMPPILVVMIIWLQSLPPGQVLPFGCKILVITCGASTFVSQTWKLYKEGRLIGLVDPNLTDYPEEEVLRYIKVALFCTQAAASRRPSMRQVLEMLSRPLRLNEKELTPPGLFQESTKEGRGLKATNFSSSQIKDLSSTSTTIPFSSNVVSFADMVPR